MKYMEKIIDIDFNLPCVAFNSVPCYKRVKQVDSHQENFEKVIEVEGDDDGGWVDTHHFAGRTFLSLCKMSSTQHPSD